jgi:hypothetical protein
MDVGGVGIEIVPHREGAHHLAESAKDAAALFDPEVIHNRAPHNSVKRLAFILPLFKLLLEHIVVALHRVGGFALFLLFPGISGL